MKFAKNAVLLLASACLWGAVSVDAAPTCINQADFAMGTLIIKTPGRYELCEDIVFHPNPPADGQDPIPEGVYDPVFEEGYDENAYGLGFFSAISITTSDVTIDLNGFTIEQSPEHALMQRFFANIELSQAPFIEGAGPAQFVGEGHTFESVSNVRILGPGTIGRSSHHGIHGNENSDIVIKEVTFKDFEVAAVSLNNVDSLVIRNCEILQNRHDVPVVGLFSAARFLRPYGKILKDLEEEYTITLGGVNRTAADVYDKLIESINNVYNDVMSSGSIDQTAHPDEYQLFHNPFGAVDGPCYGFMVHGKGPGVGGFGEVFNEADDTETSSDIVIKSNIIKNIKCWNNEVPAAVVEGAVMNDVRGAVFQFVSSVDGSALAMNADGTYKGNVVADMQIMVAKAISENKIPDSPEHQTGVNSIGQAMIEWAETSTAVFNPEFRCNGDSMHHVIKGISVIRVEDTAGFSIADNEILGITNDSVQKFGNCHDFHTGASQENLDEQQLGNIRGISVAAVRGFDDNEISHITYNHINDMKSNNANLIIGIDVQGDSADIQIKKNEVDLESGVGEDTTDKYIACRCRQFVQNSVSLINNDFVQETQLLNTARRLNSKSLEGNHAGEIEWKTGGCPFAHRREL